MWIFLNIFLPLWSFKVFADSDDIFKEILSKIFRDFLHQPCWDEIDLCVQIHPNINDTKILLNGPIPDDKVFVVKLDVFWIQSDGKFQKLLEVRLVMNWSSKEENLFVWVIKSTVADSLKKGLSTCKKRHLV